MAYLAAAAGGLFGIAMDIRTDFAKDHLFAAEVRTAELSRKFVNFTEASPKTLASSFCRPWVENSEEGKPDPTLPDYIETNSVCLWLVSSTQRNKVDPEHLDPKTLPAPPAGPFRSKKVLALLKAYREQLAEYEVHFLAARQIRSDAAKTEAEVVYDWYGPALAAIALGLRFAKVTGEAKIEARTSREISGY